MSRLVLDYLFEGKYRPRFRRPVELIENRGAVTVDIELSS